MGTREFIHGPSISMASGLFDSEGKKPGHTQLQVIPCLHSSQATSRVRFTTPPLTAQ